MEVWDIYNREKQRTGRTMVRDDWHMKEEDKSWAPGWWEVSGGAAVAGEDSRDAVVREIREETGLDVSGCEGGFLFSYRRENPGDNYFVDVYRFQVDFGQEDVVLQEEEASGFMIADLGQIEAFGRQGIFGLWINRKGKSYF